ncbi:MAG: polyprenyl synthetase family protein [Pseudomonadota bacterium]
MTITEVDLAKYQQRVNQLLTVFLSDSGVCQSLYEAMRYAVLEGGKRLRPLLIYAMGEALGLTLEALDHAACSVELIHAYSLIHDDLPMMDNDDWRRGNLSCHKRFGEALALLAGDALQALAFEILVKAPLNPLQILAMLKVLAKAVGPNGMVGGQAMEFSRSATPINFSTINLLKTGSLFRASLELAGIAGNVSSEAFTSLGRLGNVIGLTYQLQDDICDNQVEFLDLKEEKVTSQRHLLDCFEDLSILLPIVSKQFLIHLFHRLFPEPSYEKIYR